MGLFLYKCFGVVVFFWSFKPTSSIYSTYVHLFSVYDSGAEATESSQNKSSSYLYSLYCVAYGTVLS